MKELKPKLYIHTGRATHFLQWEIPEFKKHFRLVRKPSKDVPLLAFGPDVLREAAGLPASKRFAVLFPGFGHNPLYNGDLLESQRKLIDQKYEHIFINKGPLQIAYKDFNQDKISLYPFSVDVKKIGNVTYRKALNSLIHVSNDAPQKDWRRSEEIMKKTGLAFEVYPPRSGSPSDTKTKKTIVNFWKKALPAGYVSHESVIERYKAYDGFVHVARDIKDRVHIDGKYTASLIEAGMSGSILFWHDTFGLGNDLETVFNVSLDPEKAAKEIIEIKNTINVEEHSKKTREEMVRIFNPQVSVAIRAKKIKELI